MKLPSRGTRDTTKNAPTETPTSDKTPDTTTPGNKTPGDDAPKTAPPSKLATLARKTLPPIAVLTPLLILPLLILLTGGPATYTTHVTLTLTTLIPLIALIAHQVRSRQRVNPPKPAAGKPRKRPQAPLRSWWAIAKDTADIALFLDTPLMRGATLVLFAASIAGPLAFPLGYATIRDNVQHNPAALTTPALLSVAGPIVFWAFLRLHTGSIIKTRSDAVLQVWQIAKDYLRYPKKLPANPTKDELRLMSPLIAIDVKKWKSLTDVDTAFVIVPSDVSVTEEKPWDEFDQNLNARLPRDEGWRVRRDPRGRGATIEAANYPTAVLWDGEVDPDPLTFYLGVNLDNGDMESLTLNDVSPHILITGGTSSGKDVPLSTYVPTPSGFKQVRDISDGDLILDQDGKPAPICGMSPIRVPDVAYRLTFNDGSSEIVSDTHLWTTYDRAARRAASRQRTTTRARKPWLSDEQRATLAAALATATPSDDISLSQVANLIGIHATTAPLIQLAQAIGHSRERRVDVDFVYDAQQVQQTQTCMVMDRSDVPLLAAKFATSRNAVLREAAPKVAALTNGEGPVATPMLSAATGIDRARMRGFMRRSDAPTLRTENTTVTLDVPAYTATRKSRTTRFYPTRPLLTALIERGERPLNDQRYLMAMPKVRTTQEIVDTLRHASQGSNGAAQDWANHSIPVAGPAQYPHRDLPVDPYVLGAWLGDGASNGTGLWATQDTELMDSLAQAGYQPQLIHDNTSHALYRISGLARDLRPLDVIDNKHIPDEYLTASIDQRLALLQGLMDTDGSVNTPTGTCEFYQSNEPFARQVRSLIASLGMIGHLRSRPGRYRDAATGEIVECKEAWTVAFSPRMQVFRLARKAALIDPGKFRSKSEHRYIVSAERVEPEPMRCLMVDSDTHQFLIGDQYITTHNTSGAEIIAAQMLTKPMPWDPELFGTVHLVDPKGTLARRWRGRRGVVTSEGTSNHYTEIDAESGEPLGGIEVMKLHVDAIEEERLRRDAVLARYPKAATWVHLPDDVKRAERFAPMLVILDEYLDHTDSISGKSDRAERERQARNSIVELTTAQARKYRNVGMHTCLIAQEGKMTVIGSSLVRQLPVRIVTGAMDATQLGSMFGQDREIPSLPSTRKDKAGRTKTIPGRARFMNAGGQEIKRLQLMWFGGPTNSDTLDKYLPQGEEPLNGDFTPAEGGTPEALADSTDTDFETSYGQTGSLSPVDVDDEHDADTSGDAEFSGGFDSADDGFGAGDDDGFGDGQPGEGDPSASGEGEPSPEAGTATPTQGQDGSGVVETFPAANPTVPTCAHAGCANDATQECATRHEPCCDAHIYPSIDNPATLVCATCYWDNPIGNAGLATIWTHLCDTAAASGDADTTWETNGPTVRLTAIRPSTGRKIIQIIGAPGQEPQGKSSRGEVTGEAKIMDRISDAVGGKVTGT